MLRKETQLALYSRLRAQIVVKERYKKIYKTQQTKQFMLSRASRTHIISSRDRGRRDSADSDRRHPQTHIRYRRTASAKLILGFFFV